MAVHADEGSSAENAFDAIGPTDTTPATEDVGVEYLNLANIVKLGVGFLLVFTAFFAQQNLLPQLLRDLGFEGLGFISVASLYAAFFVACFVAPTVLPHLNERRTLAVSTLFYALYCASGLIPASCPDCSHFAIVVPILVASALIGFSAAFVWVSQGAIMTLSAPQEHVNTYMTIFQSLFQAHALVGSALASFIVHRPQLFFAVFTGVSLAGSAVLATIRPSVQHASIPRRSKVDKGPASFLDVVRPMRMFLTGDRRAWAVGAYSTEIGVVFLAVPTCVLPMFSPDTAGTAKLLAGVGAGRLVAASLFGRLSNAAGRFPVLVGASFLETGGLVALGISSAFGAGGGSEGVAMAATVLLGLGNGLQFANLAACITAAVHDKANAAFASQQSFISLGAIAAVVVLPLLARTLALAVCGSVLLIAMAFLCSQPAFFRTLAVSEAKATSQPAVPAEEEAECGTEQI